MPPRAFRCVECGRPLGQIEQVYDRHGRRTTIFKASDSLVSVERRLFAGRWGVCVCGHATRLPGEARIILHPEA